MTVMDFPTSPVNGQTTTDGRYYFDSSVGSSGAWRSTPLPVGGLPAGSIMAWGTNTPPANWLLADGSAVSRSVYSSLFAVIGTQYGAGNGTTTFNLPDLRGRVPVGRNGGTFGTLGATGGAETHTLSAGEMPSHTHTGTTSTNGDHTHAYRTRVAAAVFTNAGGSGWDGYPANNNNTTGSAGNHSHTFTTDGTGGGQAHNNLQPYQVVNYIIKFSAGWTAGDSELATRVGAIETADATTNRAGLVPVIPSTIAVSGGTATANSLGVVSFTGTTSVSLNGVFSSQYDNYRIIYKIDSSTVVTFANMRLRASGTDNTASVYSRNGIVQIGSNAAGASNELSTSYFACGWVDTDANASQIDLYNPNKALATSGNFMVRGFAGGTAFFAGSYKHASANAFDGVTFYSASGSQSGTIQVYGYR